MGKKIEFRIGNEWIYASLDLVIKENKEIARVSWGGKKAKVYNVKYLEIQNRKWVKRYILIFSNGIQDSVISDHKENCRVASGGKDKVHDVENIFL